MNIFSFLSPYKLLIEVIMIGGCVVAIGVGVHEFLQHEQNIGYQKAVAEYTAKALVAETAAREREAAMTRQLQDAQAAGALREHTIKTLSVAANTASVSLRDTLGAINRGVPTATIAALRQSTSTLSSVLDDCQNRYRTVAEAADRHASDAKTLTDAWPK